MHPARLEAVPHLRRRFPTAGGARPGVARRQVQSPQWLATRLPAPVRGVRMLPRRRASSDLPPAPRTPVGTLFAAISGNFSKSLVFGCFFPVVFFILLDWILFRPFLPPLEGAAGALTALDPEWRTAGVAGLAVLFSGLLYTLNTPIIRFYEGYPWAHSLVGQALVGWQTRRWRTMRGLARGLPAVVGAGAVAERAADRDLSRLGDLMLRRWNAEFPSQARSVLPTRLGNTIRSFEDYPRRQYGISAIPLWPRLVGVIDPDYAASADDAKSSFDFMINMSFLSGVSGAGLLLAGLASRGIRGGLPPAFWLQVAALALASYVFYAGSIGQAMAWGDLVRGAFDLYRGKLLAQLGFTRQPADLREERELWRAISLQMIFGDPPAHTGLPLLRYSDHGTFAGGTPALPLEVSRSASPVDGGWQTCLLVRNPHDQPVADVRVIDTLAQGERYVWNSAQAAGRPLPVTGTDRLVIETGTLGPGEQHIVVYRSTR